MSCAAAGADDMRARPRRAIGLSEVQEDRQAAHCHAATACAAPAAYIEAMTTDWYGNSTGTKHEGAWNRGRRQPFLNRKEQGSIMRHATPIRAVNVVDFPSERVSRPARDGATVIDIARSRMRAGVGRLLNKLRVPAAIQPIEIIDEITKQHVAVVVDDLFVRVSVNGRDYYFDRVTGRFDGTGSAG
jgi:hypothetical protein